MSPPSQYQARRLLELVSHNKTRVSDKEHIDQDVWARTYPPVRGLNFRDRSTARCCLRAGGLGAVPCNPPQLPDVQSPALPSPPSNNHQDIPRVESNQSKLTVSSVPSFGKIREPLSTDSVSLPPQSVRPTPVTEYQEFGSEALITHVQDEIDEEFDDSTPSRLFSEIGPSISVAKGIDGKRPKQTNPSLLHSYEIPLNQTLGEPAFHSHDDTESDEKSILSAPKTSTSVPSTTTTLPAPPLPPLPVYALEPENHSQNKMLPTQVQQYLLSVPPPPPPLYAVESYGTTSAVPPPPSFPPPIVDLKQDRRDTEGSSPVTDGDSYDYKPEIHDEFSDLADSSIPSMTAHWYHRYGPLADPVDQNDKGDTQLVDGEYEEESLEAEEVGSNEEKEYERAVHVHVDRNNFVGRRREGLVG